MLIFPNSTARFPKRIIAILALLLFASAFLNVRADEICGTCDRKIVVTGQFNHSGAQFPILGAPRGTEENFTNEIYGQKIFVPCRISTRANTQSSSAWANFFLTTRAREFLTLTCAEPSPALNEVK